MAERKVTAGFLSLINRPLVRLFTNINKPCGDVLMTYLSATDLAMFLAAFDITISDKERRIFMNPIGDRGQEDIGVRGLILAGVNVTLVGVDCLRLMKRIATPFSYCRENGRDRLLSLVALTSVSRTGLDLNYPVHECGKSHTLDGCSCEDDMGSNALPIPQPRIVNDFAHTVCLRCMKASYTMKAATDEVAGNALITTLHPACAPDEELGVESGSKEAKAMIEDMRGGRIVDGLMPLHTYTSINHLAYMIGTPPVVVDLGETPQTI